MDTTKLATNKQQSLKALATTATVAAAGTDGTTDIGSLAGQSLPDTTLVVSMLLILFIGWLQLESLRQTTECNLRS